MHSSKTARDGCCHGLHSSKSASDDRADRVVGSVHAAAKLMMSMSEPKAAAPAQIVDGNPNQHGLWKDPRFISPFTKQPAPPRTPRLADFNAEPWRASPPRDRRSPRPAKAHAPRPPPADSGRRRGGGSKSGSASARLPRMRFGKAPSHRTYVPQPRPKAVSARGPPPVDTMLRGIDRGVAEDAEARRRRDMAGSPPVNPADWFACRPGSGPCSPKPRWKPTYNMSEWRETMALNLPCDAMSRHRKSRPDTSNQSCFRACRRVDVAAGLQLQWLPGPEQRPALGHRRLRL